MLKEALREKHNGTSVWEDTLSKPNQSQGRVTCAILQDLRLNAASLTPSHSLQFCCLGRTSHSLSPEKWSLQGERTWPQILVVRASSHCYAIYATFEPSSYNPVMLTTAQNTVKPPLQIQKYCYHSHIFDCAKCFFNILKKKRRT